MKHKILIYSLWPIMGSVLMGAGVASAHGFGGFMRGFDMMNLTPDEIAQRQQNIFQKEADLLGVSLDDVKNGWAAGKNLEQLAADHKISAEELKQKLQDARTGNLKTMLQTLVGKGIITQAQADQRLQFLQNVTGKFHGKRSRGFKHIRFGL